MLQQVSQLAPSAPHDRGVAAGEAMGAGGPRQSGGVDFVALLSDVEAEAQESATAPSEISPASSTTVDGAHCLPTGFVPAFLAQPLQDGRLPAAGQDGADQPDGTVPAGDTPGEGKAILAADAPPNPKTATADNAAPPLSAIGPLNAATMWQHTPPSGVQPLSTVAHSSMTVSALSLSEDTTPSDLSSVELGVAAVGRQVAPVTRTGSPLDVLSSEAAGDNRAAGAQGSDLHRDTDGQAAPQVAPEEEAPTSAFRSDTPTAQPPAAAFPVGSEPLLPEGRGLSLPPAPPLTGAGSLPGHLAASAPSPPAVAGLGLPYQRLLHPQLAAQVAPALLAMGLVPGADGGPGRLTVAIRPAELGTLQIIAEKTGDGTASIAVLAERPETLQLLVRDAPALETALRGAGVGEGGEFSLTFGLASQGQGDRGRDARGEAGHGPGRRDGTVPTTDLMTAAPALVRTSLLDLSL
jgi:flagellar hook-length control protein FliK